MDLLNILQNYWFIIIFVGGIIAQWVRNESKVTALNARVTEVESDEEKVLKEFRDRVRAVELKTASIDTISGDIKGINAKLDIILKKIQL